MMILLNSLVLFSAAFLTGLAVFRLPNIKPENFRLMLIFSGAYLFSLTIVHIMPELFHASTSSPHLIGLLVLGGFLFQLVLEFFTSGVEHGHIHHHHGHDHGFNAGMLIVALFVHSFLEGTLLIHPSDTHEHGDVNTLLFGIVIHKMPEAFALASVLMLQIKRRSLVLLWLFIFSISSPLGILLGEWLNSHQLISPQHFEMLFAIVAGNFLHISTTIFFETSPEHRFNGRKMITVLGGVAAAILAEMVRF